MHGTKKPLTYWFKAMWWFTIPKSGVNAVNLKDLLVPGSYQTAWLWLHKLRRCTIRKGREQLSGTVEVDEFVIGGQHPGKRGRGANGKTVVVAAVEKKGKKTWPHPLAGGAELLCQYSGAISKSQRHSWQYRED
jgi:hypothetical protein